MNYNSINETEIENMLYLIMAHAGKVEANRFNRLEYESQRKVTFILAKRAKRARNAEQPFDKFIVREVIDDAKRNCFVID